MRPFPDVSAGQYQVSVSGGRAPVWAHSGRELFFASGTSLFAVSVQLTPSFRAGVPQRLFDDGSLLFENRLSGFSTVRSYDVAPDGRFLIAKQITGTDDSAASSSIIVVQNWAEELKQAVPAR